MKKDDKIKLPQYLPLIVKARLHTGGREYEKIKQELKGQGFTCNQMKSMVREGNYFDGLVLYLSKWNWDNHESWHLYSWDDKDDEKVMLGIYEAEQYHPYNRYKGDFEKFQSDWKNEEYDPGMIERQQAEQQQGNRLTKTLKQVNQLRPVIERAKQRMREGKENGSVLD